MCRTTDVLILTVPLLHCFFVCLFSLGDFFRDFFSVLQQKIQLQPFLCDTSRYSLHVSVAVWKGWKNLDEGNILVSCCACIVLSLTAAGFSFTGLSNSASVCLPFSSLLPARELIWAAIYTIINTSSDLGPLFSLTPVSFGSETYRFILISQNLF